MMKELLRATDKGSLTMYDTPRPSLLARLANHLFHMYRIFVTFLWIRLSMEVP